MKEGDIVYLKSGSPPLTIIGFENVKGMDRVACGWFNGTQFCMLSFSADVIIKDKPTTFFNSINFN